MFGPQQRRAGLALQWAEGYQPLQALPKSDRREQGVHPAGGDAVVLIVLPNKGTFTASGYMLT